MRKNVYELKYALIISGIIISIVHIISPFLPLKLLWGFNFFRFIPFPLQLALIIAGILICTPYINRLFSEIINIILNFSDRIFSRLSKKTASLLLLLTSFLIFWIFRSRRLYGDGVSAGYVIKNSVFLTSDGLYNSIFILSHSIVSNLYELVFKTNYPYGYFLTFSFINCLFGSVFVIILLKTINIYSDNLQRNFLIFFLLLSQGAIQIFFGHVESYAIPVTGGIFFIFLSFYYLEDKVSIVPPAFILALTSILKITTLQLYPALILLPFLKIKKNRIPNLVRELLLIFGITFLLFLFPVLLSRKLGKTDSFIELILSSGNFLPITRPKSPNHLYVFLSSDYLIAILNGLALIFPYGILLTIFAILFYRKEIKYKDNIFLFLVCMSSFSLLYNIISYPVLGPFKDWDKYSLAFLPITLLGVYLLNKYIKDNKEFFHISLLVLTFSCIHTIPWILSNNQMIFSLKPGTKYTYIRDFFAGEKYLKSSFKFIKNSNFKLTKGYRLFLEATKYDENLGGSNDKIAMQYYLAAIRENPNFSEARNNLAVIYDNMELYNDASDEFRKALEINPESAESHNNLGILYADWMWWDKAYYHHKKAVELNPNLAEAHNNLGVDYADIERYKDAIEELKKAFTLNPDLKVTKKYLILISKIITK